MSPTPASGSRLRWAPKPYGSIKNRDFAPELSAQLITAPTGRPSVILNFVPAGGAIGRKRCEKVGKWKIEGLRVHLKQILKDKQSDNMFNRAERVRTGLGHFLVVGGEK